MHAPLRALPALLLLGGIWGLTPALTKHLVTEGAPPVGLAALVGLGGAVVLWAICGLRGLRVPFDWPHLRHYLAAGASGFVVANLVAYTAIRHVPAGFFALLLPLSPMLTVALAAALGMERATRRRLTGTALGLAGTALAMAPGAALPDPGALPWAILLLVTPMGYAASNILAVRLAPPGTKPLPLAAGTLAVAVLGMGLAALLTGQARLLGGPGVLALAGAQAGLMALAYVTYFGLLASMGGVFTSQVGYVSTLSGLLWGHVFFGEAPGWLTWPAAALVFAGLALVTLPARR
jgi:drug/metabolite transporter (DMT)-like permease